MMNLMQVNKRIGELNAAISKLNAGVRDGEYVRKVGKLFEERNELAQRKIMIAAGKMAA